LHCNNFGSSALAARERARTVLSEYMTPEELADELGICRRTLDRWHTSRTGPPRVTVGRRPLYRREAVTEWLRSREQNLSERGRRRARSSKG
jgi:predicted DNA-binding transcriptional regulator AlpA